jgi:hypothetical protein
MMALRLSLSRIDRTSRLSTTHRRFRDCKTCVSLPDRKYTLSLPGDCGFLLPYGIQEIFLGPENAFQMTRQGAQSSKQRTRSLVPYDPPQPPVITIRNGAYVIVYRGSPCGTRVEGSGDAPRHGLQVSGFLPRPSIAGVLPSPEDVEDAVQVLLPRVCIVDSLRRMLIRTVEGHSGMFSVSPLGASGLAYRRKVIVKTCLLAVRALHVEH